MKPQIFNAGHDEQFRSEVLRFVEALEAGRLNEDLVPEIEVALAELGRVVDLDFEEVRRELISASRKQPEPATKSRTASVESDEERLARLPDVFTWKDLVRLWGISRSQAFVEIRILLAGKQIHETVPNSRDGRYSQSPDRPKKVERESPESRPPEKGESRRSPDRPKSVKRESPESRPPEKGGSRRSPDHPKRVKRESPESRPPYRDFVDQAEKPLNFAEIKPESVATQRVNELLDRLRAESAEVRAERDKALRDFVARREAGERFDMARVMTPFREAVESAELAQLQAESEARADRPLHVNPLAANQDSNGEHPQSKRGFAKPRNDADESSIETGYDISNRLTPDHEDALWRILPENEPETKVNAVTVDRQSPDICIDNPIDPCMYKDTDNTDEVPLSMASISYSSKLPVLRDGQELDGTATADLIEKNPRSESVLLPALGLGVLALGVEYAVNKQDSMTSRFWRWLNRVSQPNETEPANLPPDMPWEEDQNLNGHSGVSINPPVWHP